ncbi:MAG: ABC transporter ATP-binding protein [Asgard group archaeon]|nr:ABC transporter ATP-binding protein [Asgard group archaeon]
MSEKPLMEKELLLEIKDLKTYYSEKLAKKDWCILDGVNLKLYKGTTLGILGPSGSGKTVLTRSILRLIYPPGRIVDGKVIFKGKDLLKIPEEEFNKLRGKEISLVLQNAPGGIDPIKDMTFTTSQPYRTHTEDYQNYEIKILVVDQLGKVAIPEPTRTSDKFAHQLSGGESQRVKIASALINNPSLLIADEPVSNLDTTVARNIIDLLQIMKEKYKLSMLLIAHNLGVLAELSDYIAILYGGKILEYGDVETIFYSPKHPFTQALFYASPSMAPRGKLQTIPGDEPDPRNYPSGCRFHPRCSYATDKCKEELPELEEYSEEHFVACWRVKEIPDYEKAEY